VQLLFLPYEFLGHIKLDYYGTVGKVWLNFG